MGKDQEALKDLEWVLDLATKRKEAPDPEIYFLQGLCHSRMGRWTEAEACFSQALEAQFSSAPVWLNRAKARFELKRFKEAAADAGQAIQRGPDLAEAWILRAQAHLQGGDLQAAAKDFQVLTEKWPEREAAWLSLAQVYEGLGSLKEALKAHFRFLEKNPARADLWLRTARMQLDQPSSPCFDPVGALASARKADLASNRKNPKIALTIAEALAAGKKLEEALAAIEEAYTLFPGDREIQESRTRLRERVRKSK
jgi:tetratricopeptide (TPR) repeat protein